MSPWTNICQLYVSLPGTNLDLPGPRGRFQEVEVEGDGVAAVAEWYVPWRFVLLSSPSLFSPGFANHSMTNTSEKYERPQQGNL